MHLFAGCTRRQRVTSAHAAAKGRMSPFARPTSGFSAANYRGQLTVILRTFCASDYVFVHIDIFHFHSDQDVLKGAFWIDLHLGDFSQSVCHCDCSPSQHTGGSGTAQRLTDREQTTWCAVYFGSARQLRVLKRQTTSAAPHHWARGRPLTAARSTLFIAERGVRHTEI